MYDASSKPAATLPEQTLRMTSDRDWPFINVDKGRCWEAILVATWYPVNATSFPTTSCGVETTESFLETKANDADNHGFVK